jgi:hypothetical protein
MKKILVVCAVAVFLSFALYAEEAVEPAGISQSTGASGNVAFPLGEFTDYVGMGYGASVVYELGVPIHSESESAILKSVLENFTLAARANVNLISPDDTRLDNVVCIHLTANVLTKIPLGKSGFSVAPELGFGAAVNLLTTSETNADKIDSVYVDQVYEVGCGLRFSNPKFFNNSVELEITPTFSISPEYDAVVLYQAFRIGVLFL